MTSNRKNVLVFLAVALPIALFCSLFLNARGFSDEHLNQLLRLTARLAFMVYLIVFVARPLAQLFPATATRNLVRNRRSIGIAFAAMHSVHLALIAIRYGSIPGLEYPASSALVGGTAYLLMYLMLVTSFDAPARALGPTRWRRLHKTGLYFIGFVFLSTLLPDPGEPLLSWERAWFATLTSLAVFVRLTAYFHSRKREQG